jgi:hypothetical protein
MFKLLSPRFLGRAADAAMVVARASFCAPSAGRASATAVRRARRRGEGGHDRDHAMDAELKRRTEQLLRFGFASATGCLTKEEAQDQQERVARSSGTGVWMNMRRNQGQ